MIICSKKLLENVRKNLQNNNYLYYTISIGITKNSFTKVLKPGFLFIFAARSKMESFVLDNNFYNMVIVFIPHWFDTNTITKWDYSFPLFLLWIFFTIIIFKSYTPLFTVAIQNKPSWKPSLLWEKQIKYKKLIDFNQVCEIKQNKQTNQNVTF